MDCQTIYDAATKAAEHALIVACMEEPQDGGMCGAAWMVIRPARGQFVNWLKAKGLGDRGVHGGWEIRVPFSIPTQNVEIRYAVNAAFAASLRENGITASAYQRLT